MTSTITIAGPSFTNYVVASQPTVPGLQAEYYFGTGYDANNNNRVAGGPAPITSTAAAAPVYSTNFVTLGYDGTNSRWIDMRLPRNSAQLAAGWTWAAVARAQASGSGGGNVISDSGGAGSAIPALGTLCGFSVQGSASHNVFLQSGGTGIRVSLVMPGFGSAFHFLAMTYTGGAAGTHTVYEFTDNPAGTTPVTFVASGLAVGNNSPTIGGQVPNWATNYLVPVDVAWAMCAQGVMSQPAIAALAANVRGFLARRGITA